MQGGHHVAQKFRIITLSVFNKVCFSPFLVINSNGSIFIGGLLICS